VQLINAKPRKKGVSHRTFTFDNNNFIFIIERSSHHKKSNNGRPILRPIICICNDQNASSLAKLRPHAYQIRFNRPADVHIVKRLKEVCEMEGLKADTRALSTLVSVAKGDLRGCLNTLQVGTSLVDEPNFSFAHISHPSSLKPAMRMFLRPLFGRPLRG